MDSATAVQVKNVHVKRSLELSRYVKKLLHSVQGTDLGHFFYLYFWKRHRYLCYLFIEN